MFSEQVNSDFITAVIGNAMRALEVRTDTELEDIISHYIGKQDDE